MKKKTMKKMYKDLKKEYTQLQESYDEALGYLSYYSDDLREKDILIRYMHDYIHWKKLDDEFAVFQKYAHEEESDNPFPYLVM